MAFIGTGIPLAIIIGIAAVTSKAEQTARNGRQPDWEQGSATHGYFSNAIFTTNPFS